MDFFNKLKAQVNMRDGGKTFSNPQGNQQQGGNIPFKNGLYPAPYDPNRGQPSQDIPVTKQMGGMTFANRPGQQYEDESLVSGPQGYTEGTSDIAQFGNQSMQPNMQPQFEDAYTPAAALEQTGYINPQTTQHANFRQGNDTNLQNEYLRKILGY